MADSTLMESRTLKRMMVATVLVAGLVFGVTFLGQYLRSGGDTKATEQKDPSPPQDLLVFEHKAWGYPPRDMKEDDPAAKEFLDQEYDWGQGGFHEYPFQANFDNPIEVGLRKKACTCSKVEIAWTPKDAPTASLNWIELDQGDPRTGKEPNTVFVPPHARGIVRMHWKTEHTAKPIEQRTYYAILESRSPGEKGEVRGKTVQLDARVTYLFPIVFQTTESAQSGKTEGNIAILGVIQEGQEVPIEFVCWSATHKDFKFTPPKDPLVRWENQREIFGKERDDLAARLKRHVLCAYRVTAFFKGVDLGPFRHLMNVGYTTGAAEGSQSSSVELVFEGAVRGQIAAIDDDGRETGTIDLKSFKSSRGMDKDVQLHGSQPDLDLKLVKYPEDLVHVSEPVVLPSGSSGKAWKITLNVLPNKAFGPFGGPGSSRECIILFDVFREGHKIQQLRLPVTGNATSQ